MDNDTETDTNINTNIRKQNYRYLIKNKANKDIMVSEIKQPIINIICYHVTDRMVKYPFIQVMVELEGHPLLKGISTERFVLPSVYMSNVKTNLSAYVLNKIKHNLEELGCDTKPLNHDAFLGVINVNNSTMLLVDISSVDIFRISNSKMNTTWFALPTEIMNTETICNIPIDKNLNNLFSYSPELGVLHKPFESNIFLFEDPYPLPDAVYTGSHFKQVEFNSVFGVSRKQLYSSCGEYFYFYRLFEDAVMEGGWLKNINDNNKHLIDNECGRYIKGGINRYALFPGDYVVHNEKTKQCSLTDDIINGLFGMKNLIVIQYENEDLDTLLPDLLVKEYEQFVPISYHILNKVTLGDKYEIDNQDKFMVL
jgi:hypothetical protein